MFRLIISQQGEGIYIIIVPWKFWLGKVLIYYKLYVLIYNITLKSTLFGVLIFIQKLLNEDVEEFQALELTTTSDKGITGICIDPTIYFMGSL